MAGTKEGAAKARALKAARGSEAPSPVSEPWYVVGRKPLKHGDRTYQVGDKFPFPDAILRLESWVNNGFLIKMS